LAAAGEEMTKNGISKKVWSKRTCQTKRLCPIIYVCTYACEPNYNFKGFRVSEMIKNGISILQKYGFNRSCQAKRLCYIMSVCTSAREPNNTFKGFRGCLPLVLAATAREMTKNGIFKLQENSVET
jgi:hypothetical protein